MVLSDDSVLRFNDNLEPERDTPEMAEPEIKGGTGQGWGATTDGQRPYQSLWILMLMLNVQGKVT